MWCRHFETCTISSLMSDFHLSLNNNKIIIMSSQFPFDMILNLCLLLNLKAKAGHSECVFISNVLLILCYYLFQMCHWFCFIHALISANYEAWAALRMKSHFNSKLFLHFFICFQSFFMCFTKISKICRWFELHGGITNQGTRPTSQKR